MTLLEKIQSGLVFCDGGLGTMLQDAGLAPGEQPERWNLTHPDVVREIHAQYFAAGSDIVNANTFGANRYHYDPDTLEAVITAGVRLARQARDQFGGDRYVALDIGSTGKLLEPFGELPFEEAVAAFSEVVRIGAAAGADLVYIETMNDSYETKAAVLAAKESCDLPVFCTTVYDERGKLMTGADPAAMVTMLEGLRVDALGMNCSLGPEQMAGLTPALCSLASVPVIVCPNAGLPRTENGKTVYDVGPAEFAETMAKIVRAGARIVGGCCGTTPAYIRALVEAVREIPPAPLTQKCISRISSRTHAVTFGGAPVLIGERLNPTGKKKLKQALRDGDFDYVVDEAEAQCAHGAAALDVNVGLPELDETAVLLQCVKEIQTAVDAPLQIDTTNPAAMEAALRAYNGKAMLNSVSGKREVMDAVFPLAAKYGGLVVCLTLDEAGIPATAQERVDIAKRILARAQDFGLQKHDLIFDPLAMAVSSDPDAARVTLETVRRIREELGCLCSLGVSNVSFGLPNRDIVTATFFALALQNGLNAAIMNPYSAEMQKTYHAYLALSGYDAACAGYIAFAETIAPANAPAAATPAQGKKQLDDSLHGAILRGLKELAASKTQAAIDAGTDPMAIVNEIIIPALDEVGQGFEKKRIFLPQLLLSADAATAAFGAVRAAMPAGGDEGPAIVLATVKGDVHDIGKNIVRVLLENYGYHVYDLGRDVPPERIVETTRATGAKLVGLSALMTTTVPSMEQTIRALREAGCDCRVVVGGAVLTQEYADAIGADAYAKTAMDTVRYADRLFGRG